jgi:hypothetical protein
MNNKFPDKILLNNLAERAFIEKLSLILTKIAMAKTNGMLDINEYFFEINCPYNANKLFINMIQKIVVIYKIIAMVLVCNFKTWKVKGIIISQGKILKILPKLFNIKYLIKLCFLSFNLR